MIPFNLATEIFNLTFRIALISSKTYFLVLKKSNDDGVIKRMESQS
jgi:hypothetical protein